MATFKKPVIAKEVSQNAKIGTVSATYVAQGSCPEDCPLFKNGCYAEDGKMGLITRGLNGHAVLDPIRLAEMEAEGIDSLSGRLPLRLHVVGDCKTDEAAQIVSEAAERYRTRQMRWLGKEQDVWGYTHAHNVSRESWGKVSILRSCETPEQAQKAMADGFAAAMVVGEFERTTAYEVADGMVGIPCPQQTGKVATCLDCRLCMKDAKLRNSGRVILFEAHGARRNTVKRVVADKTAPKESFAYPI